LTTIKSWGSNFDQQIKKVLDLYQMPYELSNKFILILKSLYIDEGTNKLFKNKKSIPY
jgi:hypothetical protein